MMDEWMAIAKGTKYGIRSTGDIIFINCCKRTTGLNLFAVFLFSYWTFGIKEESVKTCKLDITIARIYSYYIATRLFNQLHASQLKMLSALPGKK